MSFLHFTLFMAAIIFVLFFGYPAIVFVFARFKGNSWRSERVLPTIAVMVPAHGEDRFIENKISNIVEQYPLDKMQIIVVYSNPVERTLQSLNAFCERGLISLIIEPHRTGKSNAINLALSKAAEEICVITDSDCFLEKDALRFLINTFADGNVGAATGRLVYTGTGSADESHAVLFNKFKARINYYEAKIDSCSYATGELTAFRRGLIDHIPPDAISDDEYILLVTRSKGYRFVYEPRAIVYERLPPTMKGKIAHIRRVVAGTLLEASRFRSMLFNPKFGFFGLVIFPSYIGRIILLPTLTMLSIMCLPLVVLDNSMVFSMASVLIFGLVISFLLVLLVMYARNFIKVVLYGFMLLIAMLLGLLDYLTGHYSSVWQECK